MNSLLSTGCTESYETDTNYLIFFFNVTQFYRAEKAA